MKFDPLKESFSIPTAEEQILSFWQQNDVFHKANEQAKDRPPFAFYEGPPTANGVPGVHHVLARTLKDIVCRYRAMRGYRVDRKAGWDTHGLPVEIEVEKQLGLEGREKVEEYGIARYNAACRESVLKYKDLWDRLTTRMGYWVDLDKAYITFHNDYIETVWWLLKQIYDKGLLYKGFKIQWYSPGSNTILSSHEVSLGYKEVQDPSVYIRFKVVGEDNTWFLAWTTTPWTLISNAALAVGPEIDYVKIKHHDPTQGEQFLILARTRLEVIKEAYEEVQSYKGKDLVGKQYEPLFDYFVNDYPKGQAWRVVAADYVSIEDGTGVVHQAPAFGAEDYEVGKKENLPVLNPIGLDGRFTDKASLVAGQWFKDADKPICRDLRDRGLMYRQETTIHNYPFDWRKGTPLMSFPIEGWFIRTTAVKDRMIALNKTINWLPPSIGEGRFGEWLENNVDWALSRRRYWGTPLPIWQSDKPGSDCVEVIGSIAELRAKVGDKLPTGDKLDLHRPYVDDLTWPAPDGGTMRRVPDVIDCWFDSGAMPFAQWHYPFENKDAFERSFPADFIAEGLDQTRGWFYTLHAIAVMVMDNLSYKTVIVNGLLVDEKGEKMSKSKGNFLDPFDIIATHGADPVRWYLISTSAPWLPIKFDFNSLQEVIRKHFDTLRNTYSFFAIYANIDDLAAHAEKSGKTMDAFLESLAGEPETFDRWIVSRFNSLVKSTTKSLDAYELTQPVRAIQYFVIEELSNWYVRNNRRRFWAKGDDPSKMRAYLTLYRMLDGVCRLSAPVSPMISELIWQQLHAAKKDNLSVHMTTWPLCDESLIDAQLEETMGRVEKLVSLGRAARTRKNLKIRQPLSRLMVSVPGKSGFANLEPYLGIIRDELNIKEIVGADSLDQYIAFSAKLNFKAAGPKLGGKVKEVAAYVASLKSDQVRQFALDGELAVPSLGDVKLTAEEVEVTKAETGDLAIEFDGALAVGLATALTPELIAEGFAREMVNKIQNMRKSSGLEVTDRIRITVHATEKLRQAVGPHQDFICRETLAQGLEYTDNETFDNSTQWDINGEKTFIAVAKV
jgi:isoleucyl-tRNA synthetase